MQKEKFNNKIIFIRHGESLANIENRFTGWLDIDLTKKGYYNAYKIGLQLKHLGFKFDLCYTSLLKRAIKTTWGILEGMNLLNTPIIKSINLNERHYGKLSGLNIEEGIIKFGKNNITKWLNNYKGKPPSINEKTEKLFYNKIKNFKQKKLTLTESLGDALKRVLKIWKTKIIKDLKLKKKIIIVAHSNILKLLLKYIEKTKKDDEKIMVLPNTKPIIYEFDEKLENFKKIITQWI